MSRIESPVKPAIDSKAFSNASSVGAKTVHLSLVNVVFNTLPSSRNEHILDNSSIPQMTSSVGSKVKRYVKIERKVEIGDYEFLMQLLMASIIANLKT